MKILFVNACVRGIKSNTLKLCRVALEELKLRYPDAEVSEVDLAVDRLQPLYAEELERRDTLRHAGNLSDSMFNYAHQFAEADKIVIGAPYWELTFPAVLRIYFELISVVDIAFRYTETGSVGTCRADELLYITTSGGPVAPDENLGFDYIQGLCKVLYGIPSLHCFAVNGLDIFGADSAAMMAEAELKLRLQMKQGSF